MKFTSIRKMYIVKITPKMYIVKITPKGKMYDTMKRSLLQTQKEPRQTMKPNINISVVAEHRKLIENLQNGLD